MPTDLPIARAPRRDEVRYTTALAALGAWTMTVPYVGQVLGLGVDVASRVEVVDHVVPGAVVAVAGLALAQLARQRPLLQAPPAVLASGVCCLAGFWVLVTHVPLIVDAAHSREPWPAAIWHTSEALPLLALAVWSVARATADPDRP